MVEKIKENAIAVYILTVFIALFGFIGSSYVERIAKVESSLHSLQIEIKDDIHKIEKDMALTSDLVKRNEITLQEISECLSNR